MFLSLGAAVGTGALMRWQLDPTGGFLFGAATAVASSRIPQTPLPGSSVRQFVTPLPRPQRVTSNSLTVRMNEFQQRILPDRFYQGLPSQFSAGTLLWGYQIDGTSTAFPSSTLVAQSGTAKDVKWVNNLPVNPLLYKYFTVDQTLHWADPLHDMGSVQRYGGPPPTIVHLHGAEVSSLFDGAPEAWYTPNGLHGKGYATFTPTDANAAVFHYPNQQQSTTLWFHDHALGTTRINVYSGLVGMYLIRDQFDTGRSDNPLHLPAGAQEIELAIADRQFDVNGQLYFPDGTEADPNAVLNGDPPNPGIHPFWIPEFFGDVNTVNGRSWPILDVDPRRYRFRMLDASNARMYRMALANASSGAPGPAIWQIGTDGGLLDAPVKLSDGPGTIPLFLAPAERADVIIDFAGFAGQTLTLINDANAPFPSGDPPDPATAGRVMQFRVSTNRVSDNTFNPASGQPLRGRGSNGGPAIVRLADPNHGQVASGVHPDLTRQLILVEVEGNGDTGPVEVFVNNTKWDGIRDGTNTPVSQQAVRDQFGQGNYLTELPRVGSTEVWEVLNMTEDAHPIHIHLIQFQLMNRQAVKRDPTTDELLYRTQAYDKAFPGGRFAGEVDPPPPRNPFWGTVNYAPGVFIPGYGPPNEYFTRNDDRAIGGNPAFSPWVDGTPTPPDPNEAGWKDTIKMEPGTITRIAVRWAPLPTAIGGVQAGTNLYSFDPTKGPGYEIHCHILDHEDNEMMRPYIPVR